MKKKILIVTICIIAAVSAGVYGTIQVVENQQEQEALNTLQQTVTENPLIPSCPSAKSGVPFKIASVQFCKIPLC